MRLTINGDVRELDAVPTVAALIEALGLPPERVAVEHNGQIVRRPQRAEATITDGDTFEIVTLVGGG